MSDIPYPEGPLVIPIDDSNEYKPSPANGCKSPLSCFVSMPTTSEAIRNQFQDLWDQGKVIKIASYGFVKINQGSAGWTNLPCDDYDAECAKPLLDEMIGDPPGPLVGKTSSIRNMWFVSGQAEWVEQTYTFSCSPITYTYIPPHQDFSYTSRWHMEKFSYAAVDAYTECDCIDPDVDFPSCNNNYWYYAKPGNVNKFDGCGGINEYESTLLQDLQIFCGLHNGTIESSYINCVYYYRCKYCYEYGCVDITGPSSIVCGNTYTYKAKIVSTNGHCLPEKKDDRIVYISYVGSKVNHNGPTTVIIPAGHSYINFNIYIPDNQTGILIVGSDSINNNTCTEQKSIVSCTGEGEGGVGGGGGGGGGDGSASCSTIGFFWEPYGYKTKLPSYML